MKKTIEYNGKTIELPFDGDYDFGDSSLQIVQNRITGEEVELPGFAVAVYDIIIGA